MAKEGYSAIWIWKDVKKELNELRDGRTWSSFMNKMIETWKRYNRREELFRQIVREEIKQMKIPASQDAVLLLWGTSPMLPECLEVMKAWGFQYKSSFVWDKVKMGLGYWARIKHEFLLIGIKGIVAPPKPENRYSSIIHQKKTKHSEKPEKVYRMIEKMFPNFRYLELFARKQYNKKWTVWGDEI